MEADHSDSFVSSPPKNADSKENRLDSMRQFGDFRRAEIAFFGYGIDDVFWTKWKKVNFTERDLSDPAGG
jgi:hypothetical protein